MTKTTKGLFLRVGMDSGAGGNYGPVFQDGQFEYIPIPGEDIETEKYCEHKCREINRRFGQHWSDFLGRSLANETFHHDPIFDGSWTYGECPTQPDKRFRNCKPTPKMSALEKLKEDDLLIFTAGLKKWPERKNDPHHIFIIGYFRVQESIPFYQLSEKDEQTYLRKFKGQISRNAHVIEHKLCPKEQSLESSVIIIGKKYPKSQLLTHALRISRPKYVQGTTVHVVGSQIRGWDRKTRNWEQILGLERSVTMSTPRHIPSTKHIERLIEELAIPDP